MMNKPHLIRKTTRLSCTWVPMGDAKRPLACIWLETKVDMMVQRPVKTASSEDETGQRTGRMHLCA